MAPIQARSPYASSIWSPLTSPNPIMDSLINNQTKSWTFASDDFWLTPAHTGKWPASPPVRRDYNFVPSSQMAIQTDELSVDLEKLLADNDDLSSRQEKRADERLPINRPPINRPPINRPPINRSPVNRPPVNQLPINQLSVSQFSVSQLANRRLPTLRGLSGSSTDVSPSSSVGERLQSCKSFAEKEYDDYYQTFDDQVDDILEFDDLQIDCSWPAEGRLSGGFQSPDSAYASYGGTPASSRTCSYSSTGLSPQPSKVAAKITAKPTAVTARPAAAVAVRPAVACSSPGNWRSELISAPQKEWDARVSVSEHQRLSFLLNIMNDNRIHVSNIPFDYTTFDLYKFYMDRKYGLIYEVELISNERGSKGFGFLSFENGWIALRARLETDGLAVPYKTKPGTRVLEVNRANPKKRFQEQK